MGRGLSGITPSTKPEIGQRVLRCRQSTSQLGGETRKRKILRVFRRWWTIVDFTAKEVGATTGSNWCHTDLTSSNLATSCSVQLIESHCDVTSRFVTGHESTAARDRLHQPFPQNAADQSKPAGQMVIVKQFHRTQSLGNTN